jgi:hypothetical protein
MARTASARYFLAALWISRALAVVGGLERGELAEARHRVLQSLPRLYAKKVISELLRIVYQLRLGIITTRKTGNYAQNCRLFLVWLTRTVEM